MPSPDLAPIPPATGGVITDEALATVTNIANRLADQSLRSAPFPFTDAELILFMMAVPGLLAELAQWRRKAEMVQDLMSPDNVLMFPGAA